MILSCKQLLVMDLNDNNIKLIMCVESVSQIQLALNYFVICFLIILIKFHIIV